MSTETPPAVAGSFATPLLAMIAGGFAPAIAAVWPAPHADFITASADRRHLICLALHRGVCTPELAGLRLRDAIRRVVPDAPDGLRRALGRLGETAWTGPDYEALVGVLHVGPAARRLRHAAAITPEEVQGFARLPAAMLRVSSSFAALTPSQSLLMAEVHAALARSRGAPAATELIHAWSRKPVGARLFREIVETLYPAFPDALHEGSERLRRLRTPAALRDAARRYDNCLGGSIAEGVVGTSLFYEWMGEPSVVLELQLDPLFGWRLEQARIRDNEPVPPDARAAIAAELKEWGVHIGRSHWQLENALRSARNPDFKLHSESRTVAELFGD